MARYIDRDKLMAELDCEIKLADNWKTAHEIANVVKYFPTADVVERKVGKWIKKMRVTETEKYISYDPDWYCSCCGKKYDPCIAKIVNFCYVCGADMRDERGNDDAEVH